MIASTTIPPNNDAASRSTACSNCSAYFRSEDSVTQAALPGILGVDLGDRHVELGPQPVLQSFYVMALVLERLRVVGAEFEGDDADGRHAIESKDRCAALLVRHIPAFSQRGTI